MYLASIQRIQSNQASRSYKLFVLIPLMLTVVLGLLGSILWSQKVPTSINKDEWVAFLKRIDMYLTDDSSALGILFVLLVTHALQVVIGLPFLHLTKMLYGYVFGMWTGFLIAYMWETILIMSVVLTCWRLRAPANTAPVLLQLFVYTQYVRDKNRLLYFLSLLDLSSIPLLTILSLVLFDAVTPREFMLAHAFASLTSIRDSWLGDFIANSDGRSVHVGIASAIFVLATLLPSMITVVVLTRVMRLDSNAAAELESDNLSNDSESSTSRSDNVQFDSVAI